MKVQTTNRRRSPEAGVAMLIAIFILLLVAVVGIALILSSGTETALAGNYRSSTAVRYAGLAGLEEARGRLLPKNPNNLNASVTLPLPIGKVLYITNPANGENVLTDYPDTEYPKEFLAAPATVNTTASVSTVGGIQGPLYRWVRINAVTDQALKIYVNGDNTWHPTTPLFYDGAHLNVLSQGKQALEITALAALPNGTQKLLQYVAGPINLVNLGLNFVTPTTPNLIFPGALTLVGGAAQNVSFTGPGDAIYSVNGNDKPNVSGCAPGPTAVPAITFANGSDSSQITAAPAANYVGPGGTSTTPSVAPVSLPSAFQTPAGLESLVRTITQNADTILTPNPPLPPGTYQTYTQSDLPTMSASNPMTIVVDGNLTLTGWNGTGYGLLVVRGDLHYDSDAVWNGIALVIGSGKFVANAGGAGQFNGAMLVANTRDSSGNPLPALGPASFKQTSSGTLSCPGIYYSSYWITAVLTPVKYGILSFREIPSS